ncbi:hypothetical protein RT41_GL000954 [Lactococcus fujiensis JCM 16395]|uniref:DNA/RNA non-specific endonuclease/pyrophosphatase/phosphodiesterase domain-containing protein n=1 Tax=Lactococcus fujiensis JCM 16395 TaxID=1291764 RepID=A0A2A5RMJ8_9LACT|nr:DNA/RNA non-specific endonuclease [Lactococcus fujiensis]PCS00572.1 hypothetical protein RT41_GL000954 [Lactococcus fujiensis JCM 16395]
MNKHRKNKKSLINTLFIIVIAIIGYFATQNIDQKNTTSTPDTKIVLSNSIEQRPLTFKNERQMVVAPLDSLGRAVNAHIQLKNSQEPKVKREPLTVDPVGWHNYNFYYKSNSGKVEKAWLMSRGHLVGYQFSGLNNEKRNLVPEPAWFNAGNYNGMNDSNTASMLYYENRLDSWLANHPHYYLDYQVTPLYKGNELIPRQIRLAYVGLDQNGRTIPIKLGGGREKVGTAQTTLVTLDNVSPNAIINYATGTATNTVKKGY